MYIIKYFILFLIVSPMCSCVHTEEIMEATTIELKVMQDSDCSEVNVDIENGHVELLDSCLHKLRFNRVRGGKKILFGKVLKDNSSEFTNKVEVKIKGHIILITNFIELSKLKTETIGNKRVFVLNLK